MKPYIQVTGVLLILAGILAESIGIANDIMTAVLGGVFLFAMGITIHIITKK